MIKQVTVKVPEFKTVVKGEHNEQRWVTSDGKEHHTEQAAKLHEDNLEKTATFNKIATKTHTYPYFTDEDGVYATYVITIKDAADVLTINRFAPWVRPQGLTENIGRTILLTLSEHESNCYAPYSGFEYNIFNLDRIKYTMEEIQKQFNELSKLLT